MATQDLQDSTSSLPNIPTEISSTFPHQTVKGHTTRPALPLTTYPLRKGQHWQKETSNRTITGESAHWGACFTGCVLVQAAAEHLDIFLPPPSCHHHTKRKNPQHNICWQKASLQSHSVTCPTISRFITLAMVQVTVWEQLHTCI